MHQIIHFCNHPIFAVIGAFTTLLIFLGFAYRVACWAFCIVPVALRFGIGLQKREVAVFGDDKAFADLKDCLIDSKIFKSRNIHQIRDLDKAKGKTIFLVDWSSFSSDINKVFDVRKSDQVAVIIFANPGSIPQLAMTDIANRANAVVVNFKGRLLNDLLTSLITTSYDRS